MSLFDLWKIERKERNKRQSQTNEENSSTNTEKKRCTKSLLSVDLSKHGMKNFPGLNLRRSRIKCFVRFAENIPLSHPSIPFSTTCKIRRHVFTTFNACIRNVKCKNKNVPEVLKSSKHISLFESRQSKILLFVTRLAAFFWVLTVHHPVVFVMTPSSATTNLFWRRFFFLWTSGFCVRTTKICKALV